MNKKLFDIHEFMGKHEMIPMVNVDSEMYIISRCRCGHWNYMCQKSTTARDYTERMTAGFVNATVECLSKTMQIEFMAFLKKVGYSSLDKNKSGWRAKPIKRKRNDNR